MELWKPLFYHGEFFGDTYAVSSLGKIKNTSTGLVRKPTVAKNGYIHIVISRGRTRKILIKVHRAVAENFLPNPDDLPQVNHIDGRKQNNNVDNLEWCTAKDNSLHAVKTGLRTYNQGCNCSHSKLSIDAVRDIRHAYDNRQGAFPAAALAKKYGISRSQIFKAATRKTYREVA